MVTDHHYFYCTLIFKGSSTTDLTSALLLNHTQPSPKFPYSQTCTYTPCRTKLTTMSSFNKKKGRGRYKDVLFQRNCGDIDDFVSPEALPNDDGSTTGEDIMYSETEPQYLRRKPLETKNKNKKEEPRETVFGEGFKVEVDDEGTMRVFDSTFMLRKRRHEELWGPNSEVSKEAEGMTPAKRPGKDPAVEAAEALALRRRVHPKYLGHRPAGETLGWLIHDNRAKREAESNARKGNIQAKIAKMRAAQRVLPRRKVDAAAVRTRQFEVRAERPGLLIRIPQKLVKAEEGEGDGDFNKPVRYQPDNPNVSLFDVPFEHWKKKDIDRVLQVGEDHPSSLVDGHREYDEQVSINQTFQTARTPPSSSRAPSYTRASTPPDSTFRSARTSFSPQPPSSFLNRGAQHRTVEFLEKAKERKACKKVETKEPKEQTREWTSSHFPLPSLFSPILLFPLRSN